MTKTVEIPVSLLEKMTKASKAFHELDDELEDYLISRNESIMNKLRSARLSHRQGDLRPFSELEKID